MNIISYGSICRMEEVCNVEWEVVFADDSCSTKCWLLMCRKTERKSMSERGIMQSKISLISFEDYIFSNSAH